MPTEPAAGVMGAIKNPISLSLIGSVGTKKPRRFSRICRKPGHSSLHRARKLIVKSARGRSLAPRSAVSIGSRARSAPAKRTSEDSSGVELGEQRHEPRGLVGLAHTRHQGFRALELAREDALLDREH